MGIRLQVIGHHTDFLRKVLKGCLLSRKLTLLQSLVQLKKQAAVFTQLTAALQIQPESENTSDLDIVPAGDAFMLDWLHCQVTCWCRS